MIFFTADLHLGHANIIKHCGRPFSSVEEMDEHLISAWNSRVRSSDTVYIIGDLIFRSRASPDSYLSRLRGKKHLILGNHDKDWIKKTDMSQHFILVERFAEISNGQHKITLCHYPLMSWKHISKGSYMIHGHIHNNRDAIYFSLMKEMPNILNAGVEINDYRPVEFDELAKNNEMFKGDISMAIPNKGAEAVPESVEDELKRVKAELAAIKKRFGIDKQEEFLKTHANITLKEFAAMLHGRDCQPNLTPDELLLAKQKGFVVVYGDSDDRVEFEGAIREEGHTNPLEKDRPAGVLVLSENGKLLDDESDLYAEYIKENRNVIKVFYCSKDGINWVFETEIPHETFLTYDGGYDEEYSDLNDGFARCIVFELSVLKRNAN